MKLKENPAFDMVNNSNSSVNVNEDVPKVAYRSISPAVMEKVTPYLHQLIEKIGLVLENIDLGFFLVEREGRFTVIGDAINTRDYQVLCTQIDLERILNHQFQHQSKDILTNAYPDRTTSGLSNPWNRPACQSPEFSDKRWVICPIQLNEVVIGFMALFKQSCEETFDREISNASTFSRMVSDVLKREEDYIRAINKANEAEAFLSVQRALTSQLDLDSVLQLIVDEARRLTNTRTSIILLVKGDNLRTTAISGPYSPDVFIGYEIPITNSNTGKSILEGHPIHVIDAENNPSVYKRDHLQVKSFISAPLMLGSKGIGAIMFADKLTGAFNKDDERIAGMFASSAVIAIENARLYREEQVRRKDEEQRRRVADGMQEILKALNSHQPLDEILGRISQQICEVLQSDACAIYKLLDDGKTLETQASYGLEHTTALKDFYPVNQEELFKIFLLRQAGIYNLMDRIFTTNEGMKSEITTNPGIEESRVVFPRCITIPLSINSNPDGELLLFYKDVQNCSAGKVNLASIVGDQVSLAIENANLRLKTEDLARLQERQRIAQALHDSVAQLLFSLGIEVEELIKFKPLDNKCEKSLQTIRQLTSRSSHELRTAIFTLREEKQNANKANLLFLIEELVETFRVETGIPITCISPDNLPILRPAVTEAIYRIVRESLSNIYKHSGATAVIVNLTADADSVQVLIQDDGIGLDVSKMDETALNDNLHFGISTMHQLVNQAHGIFQISNGDEQGVRVKACFPIDQGDGL